MITQIKKSLILSLITAFIGSSIHLPQAYAQGIPWMPLPGVRVGLSVPFMPAHLKGMVIHQDDALRFDFLIHQGDERLSEDVKKDEYQKLIKYFMASLTVPDDDQWVNLSPYEKNRIIEQDFSQTEMGRDLLAQDYLLKQITASLMYPEENLGKKFWDRVFTRAQEELGTTDIPLNTFNKVWIVPDRATVYEKNDTVYVLENHLKVMMEEDYLTLEKNSASRSLGTELMAKEKVNQTSNVSSRVVREIIIPELEREVNEGKNFAPLRQIYSGMILAAWYKLALKESLLGKIYADRAKVKGVNIDDPKENEAIYQKYLAAYKKGVFNYIKEDIDKLTQQPIPRKYFSGGAENKYRQLFAGNNTAEGRVTDPAMISPVLLNQARGNLPQIEVAEVKVDSFDAGKSTPIPIRQVLPQEIAQRAKSQVSFELSRVDTFLNNGMPQRLRNQFNAVTTTTDLNYFERDVERFLSDKKLTGDGYLEVKAALDDSLLKFRDALDNAMTTSRTAGNINYVVPQSLKISIEEAFDKPYEGQLLIEQMTQQDWPAGISRVLKLDEFGDMPLVADGKGTLEQQAKIRYHLQEMFKKGLIVEFDNVNGYRLKEKVSEDEIKKRTTNRLKYLLTDRRTATQEFLSSDKAMIILPIKLRRYLGVIKPISGIDLLDGVQRFVKFDQGKLFVDTKGLYILDQEKNYFKGVDKVGFYEFLDGLNAEKMTLDDLQDLVFILGSPKAGNINETINVNAELNNLTTSKAFMFYERHHDFISTAFHIDALRSLLNTVINQERSGIFQAVYGKFVLKKTNAQLVRLAYDDFERLSNRLKDYLKTKSSVPINFIFYGSAKGIFSKGYELAVYDDSNKMIGVGIYIDVDVPALMAELEQLNVYAGNNFANDAQWQAIKKANWAEVLNGTEFWFKAILNDQKVLGTTKEDLKKLTGGEVKIVKILYDSILTRKKINIERIPDNFSELRALAYDLAKTQNDQAMSATDRNMVEEYLKTDLGQQLSSKFSTNLEQLRRVIVGVVAAFNNGRDVEAFHAEDVIKDGQPALDLIDMRNPEVFKVAVERRMENILKSTDVLQAPITRTGTGNNGNADATITVQANTTQGNIKVLNELNAVETRLTAVANLNALESRPALDGLVADFRAIVDRNRDLESSSKDVRERMRQVENKLNEAIKQNVGGIDLNAANLNLLIKRDGNGVPLPISQQDMNLLNKIDGLVPVIIDIKPVMNMPILSELKQPSGANT